MLTLIAAAATVVGMPVLTSDLPNELAAQLRRDARRQGLSAAELAVRLLRSTLGPFRTGDRLAAGAALLDAAPMPVEEWGTMKSEIAGGGLDG